MGIPNTDVPNTQPYPCLDKVHIGQIQKWGEAEENR